MTRLALTIPTALLTVAALLPVAAADVLDVAVTMDPLPPLVGPLTLPCTERPCELFGDGSGTCDEVRETIGPYRLDVNSGLAGQVYCTAGAAGIGSNRDDGFDESAYCDEAYSTNWWNYGERAGDGCQPCTLWGAATACVWVQAYVWTVHTQETDICPANPAQACWGGAAKSYGRSALHPAMVVLEVAMPGANAVLTCDVAPAGYQTPVNEIPAGDHCWNKWHSWTDAGHHAISGSTSGCVFVQVRMIGAESHSAFREHCYEGWQS